MPKFGSRSIAPTGPQATTADLHSTVVADQHAYAVIVCAPCDATALFADDSLIVGVGDDVGCSTPQ